MIQTLIENVVYSLSAFPNKNGILKITSPSGIVLGRPKPDLSHKQIPFGVYAMVHFGTDNTMRSRSVPGIALKPSNSSGGDYFMNLLTERKMSSNHWNEEPISTKEVIQRGEE